MKFEEYKAAVDFAQDRHPEWRKGQTAFNVLMLNRPDLSEQIRATELDPYHDNTKLGRFYQWAKENWS